MVFDKIYDLSYFDVVFEGEFVVGFYFLMGMRIVLGIDFCKVSDNNYVFKIDYVFEFVVERSDFSFLIRMFGEVKFDIGMRFNCFFLVENFRVSVIDDGIFKSVFFGDSFVNFVCFYDVFVDFGYGCV